MTDQVMQKLQDHDKLFNKRFEKADKQFDRLIEMLIHQGEQLKEIKDTIATKSDIRDIMDTLDKLVGMMQKRDQEMTFAGSRIERNEKQTEKNTRDIQIIKPILGLN